MNNPDWCRWYPAKWLGGVLQMSNEQRGVYIQIINVILDRGECSADPKYIGRLCNLRSHCARRIIGELISIGKIVEADAKLHQNRAETERKLAQNLSERGRLLVAKRYKNNDITSTAPCYQPHKKERKNGIDSESPFLPFETHTNPPVATQPPPNGGNGLAEPKKIGTKLRPDWEPKPETIKFCQERLRCLPDRLQEIYEAWMDWGLSVTGPKATKRDWDRAFINAVRREMRRVQEAEERERRRAERYGAHR